MKLISEGAEARIYADGNKVIKERARKSYRIPEIDESLRKFRTRREAKVFERLEKIGFPIPRIISFSDRTMKIEMELIDGEKLRDILNEKNCIRLCNEVGEKVGTLHKNSIIHGDLTTSNMILKEKIYFIDFGLSFFSEKTEDKAVDLHLLRQALESKHHEIWKRCFNSAIKGYKKAEPNSTEILKRLEKVEERGRNKGKG